MFNFFQHRIAPLVRIKATILLFLLLLGPRFCAAEDFLPPEEAFKFSARMVDAKTAEVTYAIADGYYMYREHFMFRAEGAKLGAPIFPAGVVKFDETFQKKVETYHHSVSIRLPVEAQAGFSLIVTGQGCAEKGLCYPPMDSQITLNPSASSAGPGPSEASNSGTSVAGAAPAQGATALTVALPSATAPSGESQAVAASDSAADPGTNTSPFEAAIEGGNLLVIIPLFFLGGLALSLTPCVLPMVPILSSIIVGEGSAVTRRRGFTLSATYAFGMAIVYTALGMAAGWVGEGLAASFQNPWVLGGFGLLIATLALSMFDVYQLQMPAAIQLKLMKASDQQAAGKLAGVFVMGALSGLIVGPCVAAPLIGVLVFISKTHNAVLGGSALFATAVGMSMPLLLVGLSAGWLLPRAGVWMEAVKRFFGVLLLGVALWMVSPVIPASLQMLGWCVLCGGYGGYLLLSQRWGRISKVVGVLFALVGLVQLIGVSTGGRDALAPLAHLSAKPTRATEFVRVKSVAELDAALAKTKGKIAMLDFYADWCVSCKEMEKLTFSDARIQNKFADMVLLQADVTANNGDDKALLKRFHLFGPPGILFFGNNGREIDGGRVVGYQDAEQFASSLARLRRPS